MSLFKNCDISHIVLGCFGVIKLKVHEVENYPAGHSRRGGGRVMVGSKVVKFCCLLMAQSPDS